MNNAEKQAAYAARERAKGLRRFTTTWLTSDQEKAVRGFINNIKNPVDIERDFHGMKLRPKQIKGEKE